MRDLKPPIAAQHYLEDAVLSLEAAQQVWGVWADDRRQEAERRLGVPAGDERVIEDRAYGAALDVGQPYTSTLHAARLALARLDPEAARALRESGLRALLERRQAARRKS